MIFVTNSVSVNKDFVISEIKYRKYVHLQF